MVFDAHDRAFALFKGTCVRGISTNMRRRWRRSSSAKGVSTIAASCRCAATTWSIRLPARQRRAGRRARSRTRLGLSVTLLHAAACGSNPRRVERVAVGQVHRLRQGAPAPRTGRTDGLEVFEAERPSSFLCRRFDGFHAGAGIWSRRPAWYDSTTIILGHGQRCRAACRGSRLRRPHCDPPGRTHRCRAARSSAAAIPSTILALRAGAGSQTRCLAQRRSLKDWVLPAAIERVRRKLASADDGNRQMVDILNAVLTDGLPAVEAACAEAIAHGVHSADVVLNILARQRDPAPPANILTPAALTLRHAPIATAARYDNLRRTI